MSAPCTCGIVHLLTLTKQRSNQLALIRKGACRKILGTEYGSYAEALEELEICSFVERREDLFPSPCTFDPFWKRHI